MLILFVKVLYTMQKLIYKHECKACHTGKGLRSILGG